MLGLRLQSLMYSFARNAAKQKPTNQGQVAKLTGKTQIVQKKQGQTSVSQKKQKLHKSGPELQITKILVKNGPLSAHEIWRSYQIQLQQKRQKKQQYTNYFLSLSKLKQTLSFMRANGKIRSNGYDHKKRIFKGWKVDQPRALKYVHPQIIGQLQDFKKRKNQI